MTLSDPNPGFKVTGYLKVEYLADGARVFNCTKHSCRSVGALPKTCKKIGVVAENFLLKALKRVLHRWQKLNITASVFVETFMHAYKLSEEGFGYTYSRLKSSVSPASRENSLLRCGKIRKSSPAFAASQWHRRARLIIGSGITLCCACLFIACL